MYRLNHYVNNKTLNCFKNCIEIVMLRQSAYHDIASGAKLHIETRYHATRKKKIIVTMCTVSFLKTFINFLQSVSVSATLLLCHLRNMTCITALCCHDWKRFFLEFLVFSKHLTKVFQKQTQKKCC